MANARRNVGALLERLWYGRSPFLRALWPISAVLGSIASLRRLCYRRGLLRSWRVEPKVIVVGNLTVGGTGKTPLTVWLARSLQARGCRVGIVCSGYGGTAVGVAQLVIGDSDPVLVGDEAVLLAQQAGCPVAAGRDRVAAAQRLLEFGALDVIVSDDGLQHYRLQRDVELAVVDGTRGLGNGMCLPLGPLREPARRLRSVNAVIVNDGDWGNDEVFRCRTVPVAVRHLVSGRRRALGEFSGAKVHAVAGIGNPERFFTALERQGIGVVRHPLPDHAVIAAESVTFDDDLPIFVTAKDAVKCTGFAGNLWSVEVEVTFLGRGAEILLARLTRAIGWLEQA